MENSIELHSKPTSVKACDCTEVAVLAKCCAAVCCYLCTSIQSVQKSHSIASIMYSSVVLHSTVVLVRTAIRQ